MVSAEAQTMVHSVWSWAGGPNMSRYDLKACVMLTNICLFGFFCYLEVSQSLFVWFAHTKPSSGWEISVHTGALRLSGVPCHGIAGLAHRTEGWSEVTWTNLIVCPLDLQRLWILWLALKSSKAKLLERNTCSNATPLNLTILKRYRNFSERSQEKIKRPDNPTSQNFQ